MAVKTQQTTISHRRRCLREAEGYLELATLFDDQYPLSSDQKVRLADLCLATLQQIGRRYRRRPRVLYLSGQAHRLAGRYRQAIEELRQAWEMNASNIHTGLALGWCYKRTGQTDQAVNALQDALEVDGTSGILHYNLACYLAIEGRAGLSLIHLARAIEIDARFRLLALDEADFDTIRSNPGFQELANAPV